jgi:50S ribosomal subunit-associated GTPase HflX
MTTLKLNEEQRATLQESMTSYLSDLRMEIADTDNHDFREQLKHKKTVLEEIHAMLEST